VANSADHYPVASKTTATSTTVSRSAVYLSLITLRY
jgi:hypothetical protein